MKAAVSYNNHDCQYEYSLGEEQMIELIQNYDIVINEGTESDTEEGYEGWWIHVLVRNTCLLTLLGILTQNTLTHFLLTLPASMSAIEARLLKICSYTPALNTYSNVDARDFVSVLEKMGITVTEFPAQKRG